MAPKEIMGVTLPSTRPEDDPPLRQPHRPRQPSRPTVEVEPESETLDAAARSSRKHSPPGGIKLATPGGFQPYMPHAALLAILACFGGAGVAAKVTSDSGGDRAEMMAELRSIRDELKGLRSDVREVRDEQAASRRDDRKILNYVDGSLTPIVASLRRLGVKLEYDGQDRARDVEFHAPPLGGAAPAVQPKAVLPERPAL